MTIIAQSQTEVPGLREWSRLTAGTTHVPLRRSRSHHGQNPVASKLCVVCACVSVRLLLTLGVKENHLVSTLRQKEVFKQPLVCNQLLRTNSTVDGGFILSK